MALEHLPPEVARFYQKVFLGQDPVMDQADQTALVARLFDFAPLSALTDQQTKGLWGQAAGYYRSIFKRDEWGELAGDAIYIAPDQSELRQRLQINESNPFVLTGQLATDLQAEAGVGLMSPVAKEQLFTDPEIWHKLRSISLNPTGGTNNSGLMGNGSRDLLREYSYYAPEDTYNFTRSSFAQTLAAIRANQHKANNAHLKGLDIGGNNGLASFQAEQLDANLEMTNLTIDAEPGTWPLRGGHRFCLAERMPADFYQAFDLILSQWAFMYMRYPGLALQNTLLALSVGGIARVNYARLGNLARSRQELIVTLEDWNRVQHHVEVLAKRGIIEQLPLFEEDRELLFVRKTADLSEQDFI